MGATFRVDFAHALGAGRNSALTSPRHAGQTGQAGGRSTDSRQSFQLVPASARDHEAVHQFLVTVFQRPTSVQFHHALEAPRYEPLDRLLFKFHGEIVAHVQLCHRVLQFGDLSIPTIDLRQLGTLPEFRAQGLASKLLSAIENETNLHGALLATVRTSAPEYFQFNGWTPWLHCCYSSASPRSLIAQLELLQPGEDIDGPRRHLPAPATQKMSIRLWRRNELDALRRLYAVHAPNRYGGIDRDESDWQWLIAGHGYDRIDVAIRPLAADVEPTSDDIVGYAVVRDGSVYELMAEPGTDASRQLLVRICADAIESGRHSIEMHASANSPLHAVFEKADGRHRHSDTDGDRTFMAKLLRPYDFLERLRKPFAQRAQKAGLKSSMSLGIRIGSLQLLLKVGRRQVTIANGDLGQTHIAVEATDFTSLLLGQTDILRLLDSNRASASDKYAIEVAKVLFPKLPTWRMPWEDLDARLS